MLAIVLIICSRVKNVKRKIYKRSLDLNMLYFKRKTKLRKVINAFKIFLKNSKSKKFAVSKETSCLKKACILI